MLLPLPKRNLWLSEVQDVQSMSSYQLKKKHTTHSEDNVQLVEDIHRVRHRYTLCRHIPSHPDQLYIYT